MSTKIRLTYEDLKKVIAVLDSVHYDKDDLVEIEVDASSGIGSIGTVHVPVRINCLPGTFSYQLWGEETW